MRKTEVGRERTTLLVRGKARASHGRTGSNAVRSGGPHKQGILKSLPSRGSPPGLCIPLVSTETPCNMADTATQTPPPVSSSAVASTSAADGAAEDHSATSTIYVKNLNEKVKLPILKTSLESLFSVYGHVLSITAHGNIRMRGQAFIAFDDVEVAKKAVKEVNGFPLYGKSMQLSFAKTPSDSVVLRQAANDDASPHFQTHKTQRLQRKAERQAAGGLASAGQKRKHPDDADGTGATTKKAALPPQLPDEYLPPNPILFIQNLPTSDISREVLEPLFSAYEGLQDVRLIPGRNVAFAEYVGANEATRAREGLQGRKINETDEQGMRITFARAS